MKGKGDQSLLNYLKEFVQRLLVYFFSTNLVFNANSLLITNNLHILEFPFLCLKITIDTNTTQSLSTHTWQPWDIMGSQDSNKL